MIKQEDTFSGVKESDLPTKAWKEDFNRKLDEMGKELGI